MIQPAGTPIEMNWAAVSIGITLLGSMITFAFFLGRFAAIKQDKYSCEQRHEKCIDDQQRAFNLIWGEINSAKNQISSSTSEFRAQITNLSALIQRIESVLATMAKVHTDDYLIKKSRNPDG